MAPRSNLINPQELQQRLGSDNVRIVDCRFDLGDVHAGQQAYEAGHIPGAVFADLDADLAAPIRPDTGRHPLPDVVRFAATLGRLGIDDSIDVVVYDGGPGSLAARAWWMLRWMGHERVQLLDGGFQEWTNKGLPVVAGTEHAEYRHFYPHPREGMLVSTTELSGDIENIMALNLIDARDAARFRGEIEPIDAVAGHIPGSRNLPFPLSLNKTGRWRSRQELVSMWSMALGDARDTEWIAMCGSGVTACHLAISALEAGFREPRLYVGSWSEWIRDPARPVARGEGPETDSQAADLS